VRSLVVLKNQTGGDLESWHRRPDTCDARQQLAFRLVSPQQDFAADDQDLGPAGLANGDQISTTTTTTTTRPRLLKPHPQ
jgi:hypothetical protein